MTAFFLCFTCFSQQIENQLPLIGAQVFIEPGQKPEQIESWFRILHENGMTVCRIRMFEEYMRQPDGNWDFTLFDYAFKAAEKYNIKVFATLFPSMANNSVGGFKFPESEQHQEQIADYIEQTVSHFKTFKSLYGWVLINEPGTGGYVPQNQFAKKQFESWKKEQKESSYNSKGYTLLVNFDKQNFLLDYNTWYLNWIAQEVKKYDPDRHIHVNNHQIFENAAEYDFPAWRNFLSSLGASAHPSWHFGYFNRNQYTMALAANCEIIRSGAGKLPFWVTELQAGNNTYSGNKAFCPTQEEITQWLWTSIGTGVDGIIFWCLNPRSIGEEAGEWALLDFQDNLSDRALATKKVTECIAANQTIFADAKPIESPINILYIRESLWIEKQVQYGAKNDMDYEGRLPGGVMKSALAFYEILAESGIKSNLKEISEYDWTKKNYTGECIILANQVSVPSRYWKNIENFVQKGGKLIVEGLSAFYDENMLSLQNTEFPLQSVFGGALSEVKCTPGDFDLHFGDSNIPIHLWQGFISVQTGSIVSQENGKVTGLRNKFGKGEVVWLPALAGLGAVRTKNKLPLSDFLRSELDKQVKQLPFYFLGHSEGISMQTLRHKNGYLSIIINKNPNTKKIELVHNTFKPMLLFADKNGMAINSTIEIHPEETILIYWDNSN